MSIENKLRYAVDPADPERCQSPGDRGEGQCVFLAEPGSKKCLKHGAVQEEKAKTRQRINDYRLQIWQERVDEFAEGDNVKSLKGEIGILKLMIETVMLQCKDKTELVIYSGKISDLVMKCERLVLSCDKLETKFGMLLDKSAALVLGSKIVEIISKHVIDKTAVDAISGDIIQILAELGTSDA